ncbi:hypothetical protein EXN66_Car018807 [Channa argus]|uniref:Uncharacterized protein n=1 Tax=Channa argus TaxID=215402 RepID=A0A6G1QL67_CHAAH|nr:hypothetical protein EXN66_Car018807 [Channa argus]
MEHNLKGEDVDHKRTDGNYTQLQNNNHRKKSINDKKHTERKRQTKTHTHTHTHTAVDSRRPYSPDRSTAV